MSMPEDQGELGLAEADVEDYLTDEELAKMKFYSTGGSSHEVDIRRLLKDVEQLHAALRRHALPQSKKGPPLVLTAPPPICDTCGEPKTAAAHNPYCSAWRPGATHDGVPITDSNEMATLVSRAGGEARSGAGQSGYGKDASGDPGEPRLPDEVLPAPPDSHKLGQPKRGEQPTGYTSPPNGYTSPSNGYTLPRYDPLESGLK